MMGQIDSQLWVNRTFKHVLAAYLLEITIEFQSKSASRVFEGSDEPAAFADQAVDRIAAMMTFGPGSPPRVGRGPNFEVTNSHQSQLLDLEDAMVGFFHMKYISLDNMKDFIVHEATMNLKGKKRAVGGAGWGYSRDCGKWGERIKPKTVVARTECRVMTKVKADPDGKVSGLKMEDK